MEECSEVFVFANQENIFRNVKDMIIILSTIAIAVLFVSLMNYILLTLSALVTRAKSSAIHKTFGAQAEKLQLIVFIETLILFLFPWPELY
jgi:putative ABC transport system permease protein